MPIGIINVIAVFGVGWMHSFVAKMKKISVFDRGNRAAKFWQKN